MTTVAAGIKAALATIGFYDVHLRRSPFPGIAVLTYHGVRPEGATGDAMAFANLHVTAARLDEHMRVLRRLCTPISLEQFGEIAAGRMAAPPAAVLVTFDDGYRTVLTEALPVLERWDIPSAVFVCPDPIERQVRFWFDAVSAQHGDNRVCELKRVPYEEWRRAINAATMPVSADDPHAPLSVPELKQLARHPLITIGGHTMTHPLLASLPRERQLEEIRGCRLRLNEWLGTPVRWFAYPDGQPGADFLSETVQVVAEAGFEEGFAVGEQFTEPATMRYQQRRFTMLQSTTGVELSHRLSLTYPRNRESRSFTFPKLPLRDAALGVMSTMSGRHAALLPAQAADERSIADVRAPYRVAGDFLALEIGDRGRGVLAATFLPQNGASWSVDALPYDGPGALTLDLEAGVVHWNGEPRGSVTGGEAVASRRFDWHVTLTTEEGQRTRTTSHYVVRDGEVGSSYYNGDDYQCYEEESAEVHAEVVALAREHSAFGPVLEIGCATGGTLAALHAAGFNGYGIDFSQWAIERAAERLGPGRVWQCDIEQGELPAQVQSRGPFGMIVMAAVLEHFHQPFEVIARLTPLVVSGGSMIIITTNASSLSRRVFESDWEGYFDWTHHGVDAITPSTLRNALNVQGWDVASMHTWHVWDRSADPIHASLREWFSADARLRKLLHERELGDFITCVAKRR
jgi:peptidoglycan/xylan/chitin deacetylase (PgdA/CDA1 family)/2-polyprenyl-3-methyl-5-hydroxy-6-metoxy-1,4-benzoquinol methylase